MIKISLLGEKPKKVGIFSRIYQSMINLLYSSEYETEGSIIARKKAVINSIFSQYSHGRDGEVWDLVYDDHCNNRAFQDMKSRGCESVSLSKIDPKTLSEFGRSFAVMNHPEVKQMDIELTSKRPSRNWGEIRNDSLASVSGLKSSSLFDERVTYVEHV